jgi:predicted ATPase
LTAVEVLKQAWGIADGDGSAAIVEKVRHALESVGMDPDRWGPYLLTPFRISVGGEQLQGLSRRELKVRVFDALRRVAVEKSRREPLIIAIDDVQWFGRTPREFLSYLVENLPSARILLLTTYRPDYRPPWARKSYLTQLTLPPLSPANSLAILRTLIPGGRSAERVASAILEKAEGNPFFLEELARSAAAGDSELDLPVPEPVRAVLVARMGRLGDDARRLLHVASVIGRRVPARLLELFCEEPARMAERIAECKRLEFLDEEIVEGEPVYVFKHALVREVAYHSLSQIDRQALHAAAGRALESLHSDRLQELRDLLARHHAKSKDRVEDAPKS